jgi:hypothetical protein
MLEMLYLSHTNINVSLQVVEDVRSHLRKALSELERPTESAVTGAGVVKEEVTEDMSMRALGGPGAYNKLSATAEAAATAAYSKRQRVAERLRCGEATVLREALRVLESWPALVCNEGE